MTFAEVPLRRLVKMVNGGTPTSEAENWGGDIAWATPVDVGQNHGGELGTTARTITREGLRSGSALVPAGSVLVSSRAPIGYVTQTIVPMAFNQGCKGLIPRDLVAARFLAYALQHIGPAMAAAGTGTTFQEISGRALAALAVPLPDMVEQRAIADFLDRETAQIDAMVDAQERLVALLEERRAATIDDVVTGSEVRGRSEPLAQTGARIPEHWRQGQLKRFARVQSGLTKNAVQSHAVEDLAEVPYMRVANVQDGRLDLSELQTLLVPRPLLDRYLLRPGDVLMNEGGDNDKLGRGAVWNGAVSPCVHQNHVFAVRPVDGLLPEWLSYFNQSRVARIHFATHAVQSTNLASISATNLLRLPIAVPPLSEQDELLALLDTATARIDAMIAKARESTALMKERRAAVISAAVTGRIDVRTGTEWVERDLEEARV